MKKQGRSEGFDICDRPSNLAQIGFKSSIFQPMWHWNFMHDSINSNWSYNPERLKSGQNRQSFVPCDLEIWWMAMKNNRAPLLCYVKLCASFRRSHWWFQPGVTLRKRPIWIKIDDFFSRGTLKFNRWSWKIIRLLFYTTSFVQHFVAIGKFKLGLQSRNAQFGSKLMRFFFSRATSKFDGWPWKTIGHLFYATSCFVDHL